MLASLSRTGRLVDSSRHLNLCDVRQRVLADADAGGLPTRFCFVKTTQVDEPDPGPSEEVSLGHTKLATSQSMDLSELAYRVRLRVFLHAVRQEALFCTSHCPSQTCNADKENQQPTVTSTSRLFCRKLDEPSVWCLAGMSSVCCHIKLLSRIGIFGHTSPGPSTRERAGCYQVRSSLE
jgi:hypothetical protein